MRRAGSSANCTVRRARATRFEFSAVRVTWKISLLEADRLSGAGGLQEGPSREFIAFLVIGNSVRRLRRPSLVKLVCFIRRHARRIFARFTLPAEKNCRRCRLKIIIIIIVRPSIKPVIVSVARREDFTTGTMAIVMRIRNNKVVYLNIPGKRRRKCICKAVVKKHPDLVRTRIDSVIENVLSSSVYTCA